MAPSDFPRLDTLGVNQTLKPIKVFKYWPPQIFVPSAGTGEESLYHFFVILGSFSWLVVFLKMLKFIKIMNILCTSYEKWVLCNFSRLVLVSAISQNAQID